MYRPLEVQAIDIVKLGPQSLTDLLNTLLSHEAARYGIPQHCIQIGTKINVPDGGIDAYIEWTDEPKQTNFLPCRACAFQVKSGNISSTMLKDEFEKNGNIKPKIDDVLNSGAAYILFTNQHKNKAQIDLLQEEIQNLLRQHLKEYSHSASIHVYAADHISRWINCFLPVIIDVRRQLNQSIPDGLMDWEGWKNFENSHQKTNFVADEGRESVIETIRTTVAEEKAHVRILGLSGIGKTRLALEALEPSGNTIASNQVVYVDTLQCKNFDAGIVHTWISRDWGGILVVDNCDLVMHQALVRQVTQQESKFSLLTLHFETGQTDDKAHTFQLKPMDDKFIAEILAPIYKHRIQDFDRIVEFAQGFPQMAVLLADARLDQAKDVGRLNNTVMLNRLLGENPEFPNQKKMLEACSLFDKFGIENDVSFEYKYIAENIADVDHQSLYRYIAFQTRRGVINRAGRYGQVVPKPLAITLAADWWDSTSNDVFDELLETRMPGQLETSFCDQVAKLEFLPFIKERVKELCGEQGPFGQAEVILSPRGARLFRSFVQLDPPTTSNAIHRVLSSLSDAELHEVSGDTRRNLIYALEKLCYRLETFENAAWSLMLLASNENEAFGNNATGIFTQLFQLFLSGTSAPPIMRVRVIDSILELNSESKGILAISALSSVLDSHRNSRLVGAEFQGSNETFQDWQPKVWQEAFDYWSSSIERLTDLALSDSPLWREARTALGKNIRPLAFTSKVIVDVLDEAILKIVNKRGPLWIEAVESITQALEYDSSEQPEYAIKRLRKWEQHLQPTASDERLTFYVVSPITDFRKTVDGEYIDYARVKAEKLAEEFANDIDSFIPCLPKLLETVPRQGFNFGRILAIHAVEWARVFECTLNVIKECSKPNVEFLRGLLSGIYELNPSFWNQQLATFAEDPALSRFYPSLLTTGSIREPHLTTLVEKLKSNAFDVEVLVILGQSRNLHNISSSALSRFLSDLSDTFASARWVALDILTMHCHSEATYENFHDVLRKITLEIPTAWEHRQGNWIDTYEWKKAVIRILSWENEREFAITISKSTLSLVTKTNFSETSHVVEPILREALRRYSDDVWDVVTSHIDASEYSDRFHLRHLFRREKMDERESQVSLFETVPEKLIKKWCKKSPEVGPVFLAETTRLFEITGDRIEISKLGHYLIDNFGNSDAVLDAIDANIGSFWFVDSAEVHFQREIGFLNQLIDHPISKVRHWSKNRISSLKDRITLEQRRVEERAIGIF